MNTTKVQAYGAQSATSALAPLGISRREPGAQDVEIEILYCGVCHSDLHTARNEWSKVMPTNYPCVPGHEIVGKVKRVGKGFLTGAINADTKFTSNDFRNRVPRFDLENRQANQALVELIGKFAAQKKATPAQVALAWLLAQKPWMAPIPGTTKPHRLRENIGAVSLELTREDLRELENATSKIKVQGARYPEELQKLVGR